MNTTETYKSFLTEEQIEIIKDVEMDVLWMLENGFSLEHTRTYMFGTYSFLPCELRRMILNSATHLAENPSSPIVFR